MGEVLLVSNAQEEEEEDDFIGSGLFFNSKPREVEGCRRSQLLTRR